VAFVLKRQKTYAWEFRAEKLRGFRLKRACVSRDAVRGWENEGRGEEVDLPSREGLKGRTAYTREKRAHKG